MATQTAREQKRNGAFQHHDLRDESRKHFIGHLISQSSRCTLSARLRRAARHRLHVTFHSSSVTFAA